MGGYDRRFVQITYDFGGLFGRKSLNLAGLLSRKSQERKIEV